MIDWNAWIVYFLYIEMGIFVGVLLKQKFVPPSRDASGALSYGTIGQFALGIGVTFGFQLLGTDYMQAWAASTAIATTGNLLPLGIDRIAMALETRKTQTSIDDLKDLLTGNSVIMEDFVKMMVNFANILGLAEELNALGLITGDVVEEESSVGEITNGDGVPEEVIVES